jgi:hypothetical protein
LVNYDFFEQYLVLGPLDTSKGWGIFANIGLADQATNPVRGFLNLKVGGDRPLPGRPVLALTSLHGAWPPAERAIARTSEGAVQVQDSHRVRRSIDSAAC